MDSKRPFTPLIRTKMYRPPVSSVHVHRQKLLGRLNQQLHRPLTLVCASAGYGKSSLVSCWLEECELPSAWLSLDETDNDIHLFLSYVLAAIQTIFPQFGEETKIMLKAPQLPPLPVLATCLINELDMIDEAFIFAIDDYHLIQNNVIHELFEEILKHPPHAMHLVLASRIDPPLSLASLRAKGQMTEVRTMDLRFSQKEITQFLQQMLDTTIEASIAETFEQKTEGWITGLHLAALSIGHGEDLERVLARIPANNHFVMEYLVTEILSQQSPVVQECLLKTSILNRFCAPLCEAVCKSDEQAESSEFSGQDFLQRMNETNLFVIALDNEHKWFRYHQLFQELLQRTLEQRFNREEIARLHTNVGIWLADNGFIEEALRHAIKAGDTQGAARLISSNRHSIMNLEQWHRLKRWLRYLPASIADKSPDIVILKAWLCETWMQLDELRAYIQQVESYFVSEPEQSAAEWASLRAEFFTLSAFLHYIDGNSDELIIQSRKALTSLDPQAQGVRSMAVCMLSFGHQMKGELNSAHEVVYDAFKDNVPDEKAYHSRLYIVSGFVHWMAADLSGLHQAAGQILKLSDGTNLPESTSVSNYFTGITHYLQNDLQKADKYLRVVVGNYNDPNLLNYAHSTFTLALSHKARNQVDEAHELVDKVLNRALDSNSTECLHLAEAFQVELFLHKGQLAKARKWADNFEPLPFDPGYRSYLPQLTFIKVLLADNTPESLQKATNLLTEIDTFYRSIHNVRHLIDVQILKSLVLDALEQKSDALISLLEALNLAEPSMFIRPFLDQGEQMAILLTSLAIREPGSKYIGQILSAFGEKEVCVEQTRSDDQVSEHPQEPNQIIMEALTSRETEILKVLSKGFSNQVIADSLFISPETVKRHLSNIFRKFDVKNRQQAIASARSLGIV